MGISIADFNGDGYQDVFIANDTDPNSLFINKGDGTFEERGLQLGVAYNDDAKAVSMPKENIQRARGSNKAIKHLRARYDQVTSIIFFLIERRSETCAQSCLFIFQNARRLHRKRSSGWEQGSIR